MIPSRSTSFALVLLTSVALSSCAGAGRGSHGESASRFDGRSVTEWCALLEPEADARAWQRIPWHTSFHAGLTAAAQAERPLLLWLMNGHPLGCT